MPQADLAVLDPVWTTTYQTRDHGFLVFDTLFGLDGHYRAQPQMAEGAVTEDDGKTWRITLRPDLMFHDDTTVLARDCVASASGAGARATASVRRCSPPPTRSARPTTGPSCSA